MNDKTTVTIPVSFTGKASEFFGIWIVNLLLTLVTLGLYYPWAKVRTKRYFYNHTSLDGSSFDFHGDPMAILIGFLISVVVFTGYYFASKISLTLSLIFFVLFMIALPWFIIRSLAFRLRNTSFRNLRFNFSGKYSEAAGIYIGLAILNPFTLGLIMPYMMFRQNEFMVSKSSFGKTPFKLFAKAKDFYRIYLVFILIFVIGIAAAIAIPAYNQYIQLVAAASSTEMIDKESGSAVSQDKAQLETSKDKDVNEDKPVIFPYKKQLIALIPAIILMLIYIWIFAYINAKTANLIWNNAQISGHRFRSSLTVIKLTWLYFSNLLLIVLSVGLLIPWAKIRLAKYRMDNLKFLPQGDLNTFIADELRQIGAAGEQLGEVFDVDVGIGI